MFLSIRLYENLAELISKHMLHVCPNALFPEKLNTFPCMHLWEYWIVLILSKATKCIEGDLGKFEIVT